MTWIKLDDSLPDHPKFLGLPDSAKWLYIEALCYSSKHLTDGVINRNWIRTRTRLKNFEMLLENSLITSENDYYRIANYFKHQSSKDEVERKKALRNARVTRFREAKKEAGNASVTLPHTHTDTHTHTDIKIKELVQISFERFWDLYPRKQGKAKAKVAFEKAMKKSGVEEILAGLEKYKTTITDPQFTAMPATWLNGERWNDEIPTPSNVVRFPQTVNLPHAQILDANTQEPYCQSCGQTWPCVTESKKSEAKF